MSEQIEAWVQQALQLADARELARANVATRTWSNDARKRLARASEDLAAHLRTTPEGFVLVETKSLATAYGYLWHVNAGADAPAGIGVISTTPERAAYAARKLLREALTSEQRGIGINASRALLAASQESANAA